MTITFRNTFPAILVVLCASIPNRLTVHASPAVGIPRDPAPATSPFSTSLTGPAGTTTVTHNTNGHETGDFTLTNTSTVAGVTTLTCTPGANVTCTGFPDGNPVNLAVGASFTFSARFNAGSVNPSTKLTVTASSGGSAIANIKIQ